MLTKSCQKDFLSCLPRSHGDVKMLHPTDLSPTPTALRAPLPFGGAVFTIVAHPVLISTLLAASSGHHLGAVQRHDREGVDSEVGGLFLHWGP